MKESVFIDNEDFKKELEQHLLLEGNKFHVAEGVLSTKHYNFTFSPEFSSIYDKYAAFQNPLIYGKNQILGVVAVEVVENEDGTLQALLFFKDGSSKAFPYKPWILIDRQIDLLCKRLEGNNTFKYIRYFETKEEADKFYNQNKKYKKLYRVWNDREAVMMLHGVTLYKGLALSEVCTLAFDIEADGLTKSSESEVFLITNDFVRNGEYGKKHFRLDEYSDSGAMIEDWCKWVRELNPDIITPWNGYGYDLPYLEHVAKLRGKQLLLGRDSSPIKISTKTSEKRIDGNTTWSYNKSHIFGRNIIDTMFLAVTYDVGRKYPNWRLKDIAKFEGFARDDREYVDASKIALYWQDEEMREKVVTYGCDDSYETLKLFELMIPAFFYTCQSVAKPFEEMMQGATGGWINAIMVRAYLQEGGTIPEPSELPHLKGGISFGVPGIYRNVIKADLKSAYPSQVLRFKLYDKIKDPKAYFYEMVKYFAEKRFYYKKMEKETKESRWKDLNESAKVFINSAYGALSTPGLQFNSPENAKKITYETRQVIKLAVEWASDKPLEHWFPEYKESE